MNKISFLNGKKIDESGIFVIAEIGQAHDGSLGIAHSYIDAVAKTGADAIKFQTHIAKYESSEDEPWRINFSYEDKTRYDYWRRMEFTKEQWIGLKEHAENLGLVFLSSPFSLEGAMLLNDIGIEAWKIGSGEITNYLMIDYMINTGKPILLSTGMSTYSEIGDVVEKISKTQVPYSIFQCTSKYPTQPKNIGINNIQMFKEKYHCPVGFSDHSGKIYASLAAATLGANLIEVHATFNKDIFGPDTSSSITLDELQKLVEGLRYINEAIGNSLDKDALTNEFTDMRKIFTKSVYLKTNKNKGDTITMDDIIVKKPFVEISAKDYKMILNKRINKKKESGQALYYSDLED